MWGSSLEKDADRAVASLIKRAGEHDVYEELRNELGATIDKLVADHPESTRTQWILALDAAASDAMRKGMGRDRTVAVVNTIWEAVSGQTVLTEHRKAYRYYGSGRYIAHPAMIVFDVLTQRCARAAIDRGSPSGMEATIKSASSSLLRHQKPALLEAIQRGMREEGRNSQ